MEKQTISFDYLKKAVATLEDVFAQPYTVYIRDATIQRFEYTYEIAWKLIQRILEKQFDIVASNLPRKQLFKEAAKYGLIDDVEQWFAFREARNLTVHAYDETNADIVYQEAKKFLIAAKQLLKSCAQKT